MAHKGEFKPPAMPLEHAVERAMGMIDAGRGEKVALFMVAGELTCSKASSSSFGKRTSTLVNNIIGVYDDAGVDPIGLKEDIEVFYKECAQ